MAYQRQNHKRQVGKIVVGKNAKLGDKNFDFNWRFIGVANTDSLKIDFNDMSLNQQDIGDTDDYRLQGDLKDCLNVLYDDTVSQALYPVYPDDMMHDAGYTIDSVNCPVNGVLSDVLLIYDDNRVLTAVYCQQILTSNDNLSVNRYKNFVNYDVAISYLHIIKDCDISNIKAGYYAFIGDRMTSKAYTYIHS